MQNCEQLDFLLPNKPEPIHETQDERCIINSAPCPAALNAIKMRAQLGQVEANTLKLARKLDLNLNFGQMTSATPINETLASLRLQFAATSSGPGQICKYFDFVLFHIA